MTNEHLIHVIWTVLPLLERFEAAPYSLSKADLAVLNAYERQALCSNPVEVQNG